MDDGYSKEYPVYNGCTVCQAEANCVQGVELTNDELRERFDAAPIITGPNPKQAYGDYKVAMQLVPPSLEIHAAKALKEGALKYGAYNWRASKVEAMTYVGAMKRHLAAWLDGEEIDPESTTGKHHLDGLAASLAILLDAMDGGTLIDNRPPHGPAPLLVRTTK